MHLFLRKKVFVVHLHEATFNPGMLGQTNVTVPIEGKMKMHSTYMAYENLEDPVRQPVHFDNTPKEDLTDPIEIERETPKAQDTRSLAEKLKEIKELLDENIINEEEFEKLKKEIMDNR